MALLIGLAGMALLLLVIVWRLGNVLLETQADLQQSEAAVHALTRTQEAVNDIIRAQEEQHAEFEKFIDSREYFDRD